MGRRSKRRINSPVSYWLSISNFLKNSTHTFTWGWATNCNDNAKLCVCECGEFCLPCSLYTWKGHVDYMNQPGHFLQLWICFLTVKILWIWWQIKIIAYNTDYTQFYLFTSKCLNLLKGLKTNIIHMNNDFLIQFIELLK
jgi:hypothetical protein